MSIKNYTLENLSTDNVISLGNTGWSDPSVGTWDSNLKTGTLITDITTTIEIINDDITLDGNNHKISQCNNGVSVSGKNSIIIRNLIFETHFNDIVMVNSNNSQI